MRLRELKDNFRREKGLDMVEDQIRLLQKQVKQEIVPDEEVSKHRNKINLLENKLKNIVVRQIVKIREDRNKQTIKEAVDAILRSNREAKDKRSKKVEKYVKREFEAAAAQNMDDEDILYNRVIVNMKRLLKVLTGHSTAIDSLERKLRDISAPKKKKKTNMRGHASSELSSYRPHGSNAAGIGNKLAELQEDELDDDGLRDFEEPKTPPEYQDEIDILSEGQMEREIMME
mmetsp:Transcript_5832/g.7879  ORF Transcript_5832/g.7879 Transcript_5832/m.7879 type:complete len:231 (+) Transcript_5832:2789-3481(+)